MRASLSCCCSGGRSVLFCAWTWSGRAVGLSQSPERAPAKQQPLSKAPRPRPATTGAVRQKRDRMRPKKIILCVDDNEQVLSIRTFLLETRGYRVLTALTPHDALEQIKRTAPGTIDLLLCDLIMPQMDGNELVRRAKELHPSLPAMIVSGTVNAAERAVCADVFLPKGACSPAEMIERIRVLVARKRGPRKAAPAPVPSGGTQSSSSHASPVSAFNQAFAS